MTGTIATRPAPMWTDELDNQVARQKLSPEDTQTLAVGDGIRIVSPKGIVHEGLIEKIETGRAYSHGSSARLQMHGLTFALSLLDSYRIPTDEVQVKNPPRVDLSPEEVRDLVADLSTPSSTGKLGVVTVNQLQRQILGYDVDVFKQGKDYGGKTADGWAAQFINLSGLKRTLAKLAKEGVLRKVTAGTYFHASEDQAVVSFDHASRAGYVLASAYEEAFAEHVIQVHERAIDKLRTKARGIVADRHTYEVDQVLTDLRSKAGL